MVSGCSVPSAAFVVVEYEWTAKPIVGLVEIVGRSLGTVIRVEWGFEEFLGLQPAFGSLLEWKGCCSFGESFGKEVLLGMAEQVLVEGCREVEVVVVFAVAAGAP